MKNYKIGYSGWKLGMTFWAQIASTQSLPDIFQAFASWFLFEGFPYWKRQMNRGASGIMEIAEAQ